MAIDWQSLRLEPETIAHLRYPEGEGRGMSYFTFHGQVPPPLPTIANGGPQQQADGANAATIKEEADPEAAPAGPGNYQE